MIETVWPRYTALAPKDIRRVAAFLFRPGSLRAFCAVAALVGIYLAGILTVIPTLHPPPTPTRPSWWFLALLDQLLTGGAFGRGGWFCLGSFAVLVLAGPFGSRAQPGIWRFLPRLWGLLLLSAAATLALAMRGQVARDTGALALTFLGVSTGGVVLSLVNARLVRYRGPDILHLNILLILFLQLKQLTVGLISRGERAHLLLLVAGVAFVVVSGCYLLRHRVQIEVLNIKTRQDHRYATLHLSAVDETALDILGLTCLMFYLIIAGFLSFLTGWVTVTAANYPVFVGISAVVLLLVWGMLALIKRIPGSVYLEAVGLGNVFGFQSGAGYALRMLNHYWIVPDVPAGAATESCIEDKNRRILRQALLLFGLWFGLLLGLQFYITSRGSSSQLFPHGPLVFLCLLLMLVGDASMICGHVATRLHRSRQLLRGKARLLLQTCPIGSPQRLRQAELGTAKAEEYWKEEKFSEQWRDVWEWYRMVRREAEVLPPSVRMRPGRRVGAIVAQVVAAVFAAVLISFLGVLLCMTFVPDASSREMWPLAISLFVPSLFAPNVLWKLSKRLRARAR